MAPSSLQAPTSPLLLSCLVPLLRNLSVASRPGGDSAMAARVRVVLTAITKVGRRMAAAEPGVCRRVA